MSEAERISGGSHAHAHGHGHTHGPPPPPEPQTPMWLPAVGAVLFLTIGLVWGLSSPPKETAPDSAAAAAASAIAADAGAAPAPGH